MLFLNIIHLLRTISYFNYFYTDVLFSEKLIKWTTASTTQGGDTDTHQGTPPGEGSDVSQGAGQDASQGAGQDANPNPTLPKPPSPPADDTKDTGSQGDADSSSSKIEIPPLVKPENLLLLMSYNIYLILFVNYHLHLLI